MVKHEVSQMSSSDKKYTVGQTWNALKAAWKGYKIAKAKKEVEKQKEYARRIRKLQGELGLQLSKFPHLGKEFE
jgi:hypothetical protein